MRSWASSCQTLQAITTGARGCWRLVEEWPGSESSDSSLLSHPRVPEEWLRVNCPELLERPLSKELVRELLARPGFGQRIAELRKLVAGPYRSLYDLCRDPEEQRNLSFLTGAWATLRKGFAKKKTFLAELK